MTHKNTLPPSRDPSTALTDSSRRTHLGHLGSLFVVVAGLGGVMASCGGGSSSSTDTVTPSATLTPSPTPAPNPSPPPPSVPPVPPTSPPPPPSTAAPKATVLTSLLNSPWSLAFLPDGRMLVTQRGGTMVLLSADGTVVSGGLSGVPTVMLDAQGGLLDVALDPDFDLTSNPWVYWTYAEADPTNSPYSGTAVARARLVLNTSGVTSLVSPGSLQNVQVIYRQTPKVASGGHYGSRLAFHPTDKTLFITLGERQQDDPAKPSSDNAQHLGKSLGKVIRIHRDGSIPSGNPFAGTAGALPEIWSVGHRNPQGAALHPSTGELWITEHGAQGGDELNLVKAGRNYGWPLRSYSCPYGSPVGTACQVGGGTHAPTYEEPVSYWAPLSLAPSGLMFCTSAQFPEWRNHVLMGALQSDSSYPFQKGIWHVALNGNTFVSRERLSLVNERVRDLRQGPDGWIYVLTDSGQLIRIDR